MLSYFRPALFQTALTAGLLAFIPLSTARAQSVEQFFQQVFEQMVRDSPEFATTVGRHEFDDRWTDLSKSARTARRETLEARLARANSFSQPSLSPENRLTLRVLKYDLHSDLEAWDLTEHLLPVGQLFGFHNRVYLVIDRMPARTIHDYENILARLRAVPTYIDQNLAVLDEAIAAKLTQPKVVADLVTNQIQSQAAQDADHTHLLDAFRNFPSSIQSADQQRLKSEAVHTYEAAVQPAWRKLHEYMTANYAKHVRPTDSISSLPDGHKAYAILVRRLTTTNLSPDEIHRLGLQEVERIEAEMTNIARGTGFSGPLIEFQTKIKNDPAQHFRSEEEMLAYCRNVAMQIMPELPNQFRHIPVLLFGVRPIPADRAAATATNAQSPAPDFTKPGWFNLNTYQPEKQVRYDKESLVLHEAIPGHIFQGTVAETQANLPEIRKFYSNSAYGEGWALYVESLGPQLGLYRDPLSRFGQLASERFRAVRLVVDTGIHELGWTREKALAYFAEHAPEETSAEVDRYISWPAQALSYKVGQLRIQALRNEAEQQLGSRFDIRDFHDAVLRDGRLPMELLAEQVHAYITTKAAQ